MDITPVGLLINKYYEFITLTWNEISRVLPDVARYYTQSEYDMFTFYILYYKDQLGHKEAGESLPAPRRLPEMNGNILLPMFLKDQLTGVGYAVYKGRRFLTEMPGIVKFTDLDANNLTRSREVAILKMNSGRGIRIDTLVNAAKLAITTPYSKIFEQPKVTAVAPTRPTTTENDEFSTWPDWLLSKKQDEWDRILYAYSNEIQARNQGVNLDEALARATAQVRNDYGPRPARKIDFDNLPHIDARGLATGENDPVDREIDLVIENTLGSELLFDTLFYKRWNAFCTYLKAAFHVVPCDLNGQADIAAMTQVTNVTALEINYRLITSDGLTTATYRALLFSMFILPRHEYIGDTDIALTINYQIRRQQIINNYVSLPT